MSDDIVSRLSDVGACSEDQTASRCAYDAAKEIATLRETNRRLHRRLQEAESGVFKDALVKDLFRAKNENAWRRESWSAEFDRVLRTHTKMKEAYEFAAPILGLPTGPYHSVMDSSFGDALYKFKPSECERGTPFANVYLSKMGGIISFDIVEVVGNAIAVLSLRSEGRDTEAKAIIQAYADAIEARRR